MTELGRQVGIDARLNTLSRDLRALARTRLGLSPSRCAGTDFRSETRRVGERCGVGVLADGGEDPADTIWQLIVESAPGRTGPPLYVRGRHVPASAVHYHVTAEGIPK